jgi:3-methyladenine DNA glycosylase AlkD
MLLKSEWHEERLVALLHWVQAHSRADDATRVAIHGAYLKHLRWVNNWDLVDSSAEYLVGPHLPRGGGPLLTRLVSSSSLWERRVAMIATFHGIRRGDFEAALRMAKRLLDDDHDLIHKAVGWMLREIGKRDLAVERAFLDEHAARMPRTALRYAIERMPEAERRNYMAMGR